MPLIAHAVLAFIFAYCTILWFFLLVVGIPLREELLPESPLLSLLGLRPPFFGYAAILATVLIVKVCHPKKQAKALVLLSVLMIAEAGCLFAPNEVATACQDIFKMALSQFVVLFGKAVFILITTLFNKIHDWRRQENREQLPNTDETELSAIVVRT